MVRERGKKVSTNVSTQRTLPSWSYRAHAVKSFAPKYYETSTEIPLFMPVTGASQSIVRIDNPSPTAAVLFGLFRYAIKNMLIVNPSKPDN